METAQLEAPGGMGARPYLFMQHPGLLQAHEEECLSLRAREQVGKAPGPGPSPPGEADSDSLLSGLGWASWLWLQLQYLELFHCLCPGALVSPATGQELECPAEDKPHAGSTEKTG